MAVRETSDWGTVARLLERFNTEFQEPCPPADVLTARLAAAADVRALVVGNPPHGLVVFRLRPSIWSDGLECYLAELYVAPEYRGRGHGRALLDTLLNVVRGEGAAYLELNTDDEDHAAHRLYESVGLRRTANYYELELTPGSTE